MCARLSVITPVYNRASLLENLYASLLRQTCADFEWIVVDDGSTDGSFERARSFPEKGFPIRVLRKENGGKHTAINCAIPFLQSKYTVIADSDDSLTENAVARILQSWERYEADASVGFLIFERCSPTAERPFCRVKHYGVPVDYFREKVYPLLSSDCCEVLRTDILRAHPFPVFPGERFIGESALWYRIAAEYLCVYIGRPVYICEYSADGLTAAGRRLRLENPAGGRYVANLGMKGARAPVFSAKQALLYVCYSNLSGLGRKQTLYEASRKPLTRFFYLPGILLARYWKKKYLRK